jgi:hypothetical protein
MPFYSVPGVYPRVNDQSQFSRPSGSTPSAIVVVAAKGPVGKPVLCTSPADYIRKFGAPNAAYSLATYAAFTALGADAGLAGGQGVRGTSQLWVVRAHNAALYGALNLTQATGLLAPVEFADPAAYAIPAGVSFTVVPKGPGAYAKAELAVKVSKINATNHSFEIAVYAIGNFNQPLETFTVSKRQQRDGFGRPMYLEDAVNPYSKYIDVFDNPAITADPVVPMDSADPPAPITNPVPTAYTTGTDGSAVTDGQLVTAWGSFPERDIMPLKIGINGGFASAAVHQQMNAVAANRLDLFCLLDMPSASQEATAALTYRQTGVNLNSYHSALFTPDYEYFDPRIGVSLMVPMSGAAARNAAYVDANFDLWWPFAGQDRGAIPDAMKLRYDYSFGERGLLYDNQINVTIRDNAAGIYIDGNRTAQVDASAMQSIHISRLVKHLLIEGAKVLKTLKFEFNNPRVRAKAVALIDSVALPVKRREGLYDYSVVCNDSNNTPDSIDRNEMYVDFYIKPVRDVEFIPYTIIVNRTDVILPTN